MDIGCKIGFIKISDKTNIFVYGAGEVGESIAVSVQKAGFNLVGFIDRAKSGVNAKTKKRIYSILELDGNLGKEDVVVIALADGMAHKSVVETLSKYGAEYAIMLPMQLSINSIQKVKITSEYNDVIRNGICDGTIAYRIKDLLSVLNGDLSYIKEDCDVVVWVRPEILYTESVELGDGDKTKIHTKSENMDVNIAEFCGYVDLINYINGETDDLRLFWNTFSYDIDDEFKICEVLSREKLFRLFDYQYSFGLDFFKEGAPRAIWNENRFNLCGGHHRTLYLLYKGNRLLPIRISREDYDKWINLSKAELLLEYMRSNNISSSIVPIPNMIFDSIISDRECGTKTIMDEVRYLIRSKNIEISSLLDLSFWNGYFARSFGRTIKGAVDYVAKDGADYSFTEKLLDLLYLKQKIHIYLSNNALLKKYDMVVVTADFLDKTEEMLWKLKKLAEIVEKLIIIEIKSEYEERILACFEKNKFTASVLLHKELFGGEMRSIYAFVKE